MGVFRFISPVVMVTKAGGVMAVKRAGLTHAPAITMQALCAVEDDPVNAEADAASVIDALRAAFGAPPDMTVPERVRRAPPSSRQRPARAPILARPRRDTGHSRPNCTRTGPKPRSNAPAPRASAGIGLRRPSRLRGMGSLRGTLLNRGGPDAARPTEARAGQCRMHRHLRPARD